MLDSLVELASRSWPNLHEPKDAYFTQFSPSPPKHAGFFCSNHDYFIALFFRHILIRKAVFLFLLLFGGQERYLHGPDFPNPTNECSFLFWRRVSIASPSPPYIVSSTSFSPPSSVSSNNLSLLNSVSSSRFSPPRSVRVPYRGPYPWGDRGVYSGDRPFQQNYSRQLWLQLRFNSGPTLP